MGSNGRYGRTVSWRLDVVLGVDACHCVLRSKTATMDGHPHLLGCREEISSEHAFRPCCLFKATTASRFKNCDGAVGSLVKCLHLKDFLSTDCLS